LGVTLSFLIASSMINEVALVLLWGFFGAKIALIYIGTGMVVVITAGFILGKIPAVEKMAEDYVWEIRMGEVILPELTWKDRFEQASDHIKDILKRVILMAVTAISVPEMVILRKVLKVKLLVIFVAIMTIAIIMVGYLFNAII
jgi:uncharacterized membrane protein YraQ (UPF0718 family)